MAAPTLRKNRFLSLLAVLIAALAGFPTLQAQPRDGARLSGRVVTPDSTAVDFATLTLEGTTLGCSTDAQGRYRLQAPAGTYQLVVSAVGYETLRTPVTLDGNRHESLTILLRPAVLQVEEVVVETSAVSSVRHSPFNAVALATDALRNSTRNLGDALAQLPGMKLRESGGVGSDMQLMLDGFSGRHVKVFIDGVPQEGASTAFDLNNIPVNYAERIEVYKGVVPVEFGSDAIGGVVNIVTRKERRSWFADASYSYGSFNTHRSHLNAGQRTEKGFTWEINAFQNYSDNDYRIDNWVREFEVQEDGTVVKLPVDEQDIRRVRRFHDRFHNEVIQGRIGLTDRRWADRLLVGFAASNFYKEIQTGVYQEIVFGQKHRRGHSFTPSLEYRKRDLLLRGLDLTLTANYNHNITRNIDTAARAYNWLGQYYVKEERGEQSYQNSLSRNTNWNLTLNLNYRISHRHTLTLNHVTSDFRRTSRSYTGTSSVLSDFDIPKLTRKHISGLSYRLIPSERWNLSLFGKYYRQYNRGPVSQSADGVGDYVNREQTTSAWGYGAAGTWYILRELQLKLSYEKALRLPTTDELFGDEDLEAGRGDLRPERSDNCNLNLSYTLPLGRQRLYLEGSLLYRNTRDYIKRGLDKHGSTQYGIYENHGHVRTRGVTFTARYEPARWLSLGGTFSNIDTRDYEKRWTGSSAQESLHYKVRLPNIPYRYASFDLGLTWHDLFARGSVLRLTYDNFWQHDFPLTWENIGDSATKARVPEQFAHNLALSCSLMEGRYNLSLECRNLTDERLYDNFSLQKAGRAFYVKLRVHFGE